jgi:hypothetical protein
VNLKKSAKRTPEAKIGVPYFDVFGVYFGI